MEIVRDEIDRVFFETGLVRIGAFRCRPEHPSFQDTGPIKNYCFVFPRTAVAIKHEHESTFVANANVVTFYNFGQVYVRDPISPEGDNCDWFGVKSELVRDVVRAFDSHVDNRPERPFLFSHGWSDASTYLLQRRLFTWVTSGKAVDPLAVEETVISLLDRVLRTTYSARLWSCKRETSSNHHDTIHDIETILSRHTEERLTLRNVAREVGLSAYHVCRLFRRVTGITLHQYRLRLRLREALTGVVDSGRSLTDIALDAGFSSHSHFTGKFHHEFGATPSSLRGPFRAIARCAISW
jgi:AraC-like DNA-binding protein